MNNSPTLHLSSFDPEHENYFHANTFSDHIRRHHLHVLKPHRHNFYVCVCFTAGSGWHEIDFRKYDIQRGSLFIISPGQTHNWQFSDDTEGFIVLHSAQFLQGSASFQQLPFFGVNPVNFVSLNEQQLTNILPCFEGAFSDYSNHTRFFRQTCNAYLSLIYHKSAGFIAGDQQDATVSEHYRKAYARFAAILETNFRSEHTAAFYAEKTGMSTRQLNRICTEVSGNTTGGLINGRLLLESQTLLAENKHELAEISDVLGFNEYSYFSRWFKKLTGISPQRFRAKYSNVSG